MADCQTDDIPATRQHLVDPEVCSGCLSCIAVCPERAIEEAGRRAVIDPDRCKFCRTCVDECTTGAIDTWVVLTDAPFSLEEQIAWHHLPNNSRTTLESKHD